MGMATHALPKDSEFLKASMLRANRLKRVSDLAIFGSEYWFLFSIPVHDDTLPLFNVDVGIEQILIRRLRLL